MTNRIIKSPLCGSNHTTVSAHRFIVGHDTSQKGVVMSRETDSSAIPDALKHFDELPNSANVRQPVVQGLFGCSHATIWRMVKKGSLPAPRKLSERVTAWNVGDLRKALSI